MLLHGGLLLFSIVGIKAPSSLELLPKGTNLAYVEIADSSAASASFAKPSAKIQKSLVPEVASPDDIVEKSDKKSVQNPEQMQTSSVAAAPVSGVVGQGLQSGATHGREGVENGVEVSPEARYLYELKKLLERKKTYPQMAKAMGYTGTVEVEFVIGREGDIQSLKVVKGAHPVLDEAAQKLVRSIEKQKPFPQEITKTEWAISVPIEYLLR